MDPSSVQVTPSIEEDEWVGDNKVGKIVQVFKGIEMPVVHNLIVNGMSKNQNTDGFVIPSLGIEDPDRNKIDSPNVEEDIKLSVQARREESIYLGPHGAPPSQAKQQEQNTSGRKQRFKQKLKEADRRNSGNGRENKVDNLRDLVGGGKMPVVASKSSRDWLDSHCHESLFERRNLH